MRRKGQDRVVLMAEGREVKGMRPVGRTRQTLKNCIEQDMTQLGNGLGQERLEKSH